MKHPLTPDQVRERFIASGQTITEWARSNGYDRNKVYQVLGGQCKAKWGKGHEIAVHLGLKATPANRARKAQALQGETA